MKWQSKAILAVALILAASAGWALRPDVVRTIRDTVIVELPPTELLDRVEALRIENEGIRARLEAREERPPSVILRSDTVISPPDTVFAGLHVDAGGRATLAPLILETDSVAYRPEVWQGIDVSDCDEGFSIVGGEIICDRARLGHLYGFLGLSGGQPLLGDSRDVFDATVGLLWRPSYRSGWAVEVAADVTGRVYVGVRREIRIF